MSKRHRLLERQLARYGGDLEDCPEWVSDILDAVSRSYSDFDADRAMLERTVELSSNELFQANSEMRTLLSVVPDLFLWLDPQGNIQSVHAGKRSDLVLAASQLVGKRIQDVPDPVVAKLLADAIDEMAHTRTAVALEYPLVVAGIENIYEARLLPLLKDQTLAMIRNVTQRRAAEADLANEKERLAVTLRSIGDGVIATDTDGLITMMNRVAEELCGTTQAEARGRAISEVFSVFDAKADTALDPVARILSGDSAWIVEEESLLRSGAGVEHRVSHSASAIRDQQSHMIGVAVCFRDVGERIRAEEDRLRASKLDSVGLLAGGIAHDFNNILMSLLASASLAKLEVAGRSKLVKELLDEIETATLRARDLTQQLLTFSKGGAPVKETGSMDKLLRESAVFALRGSNVRCKFELEDDLFDVDMDAGQMSQVINNLIINADQAMPSGGTITVSAGNCPDGKQMIWIDVTDEGIGIPESCLANIFDPYFTTKQHGSGLGLATSYSIIKNHGGDLKVESQVGKGTTFHIVLPASAETAEEKRPSKRLRAGSGRVLLMDDEPAIQRITLRMLRHLGYDAIAASSGEEALVMLKQACERGEPFCAILMDLTVPGAMGGVETLQYVRELDANVRAIASSGYSNDPVLAHHEEYGFDGSLAKPYSVQELGAALARTG